ncbi:MAG: CP12 domain-containing protein, partial [Cyanobacteria bacterium P01_A01_bin.3]
TDPKARAAWDAVEELQAEAGHQAAAPQKSALDKFCEENPEAGECLIYEE